jgi:predicted peptidase
MRMIRFSIAILLAGIVLPAAHAQQPNRKESTTSRIQKKTYDFKEAGKEMEYAVFVPSNYDKAKKTPLVVLLHGLGSNPQQIMRYPGLTDQAEKYGFIVVAPMGYNAGGWYGAQFGRGKMNPENLPELSEKDVMNVLEIARKDFNTDPDRTYLMGHSMGGGGTWHLGLKYPDQWAALAPLAPAIYRPATDVEKIKHIPVILVQGDADILCPVSTARKWVEQMDKFDMTYRYVEIKGGGHMDVAIRNLPEVFDFLNRHKRGEHK